MCGESWVVRQRPQRRRGAPPRSHRWTQPRVREALAVGSRPERGEGLRVPTRFVQKLHCKGVRRGGSSSSTPNSRRTGPGARQRSPGRPHRGSRARVRRRRVQRPGLYPVRRRALQLRSTGAQGQGRLASALGDQGRAAHVLLHGRAACPWNGRGPARGRPARAAGRSSCAPARSWPRCSRTSATTSWRRPSATC